MKTEGKDLSGLLLKASFFGTFAESALAPIWATLVGKVGGSLLDVGIGYAIFMIVTGALVMTVGQTDWFNDRAKAFIFWGFLIAGVGDVAYLLVGNKWELFLVQCIIGISVGFLNPAWDAVYSTEIEEGGESKAWSLWSGGVSFFMGVSGLLGSFIVWKFGFNYLFITMGLFDIFAVLTAWRVWKHE
jgi:hypothetical protein